MPQPWAPPATPPEGPDAPWSPSESGQCPPGVPLPPAAVFELHPVPVGGDGFPLFGPGSLASFNRRAIARIIDTLLLVVPFGIVVLAVWTHSSESGDLVAETVPLWFTVGMRLVAILYETVAVALTGSTIGKAICRLRVEDADGSRPGLTAAAARITVPDLFSLIPLFGWAITVVLYVSARHVPLGRHLYDRLAGTVVVATR